MKSKRRLVTVAATIAMFAAVPHTAMAQESDRPTDTAVVDTAETDVREHTHTLEEVKKRALAAIDKRLAALSRVSAKVSSNSHVTEAHATTLQRHYGEATDGLQELAREIEAADTREKLRELIPQIAAYFRVYLVILPKSHEVIVSDSMADAVDRMSGVSGTLLEAIERAEEAGYDMTEARRWLGIANEEIRAVETGAVPVADSVVGLTAEDWEEPAKSLLAEGKRKLETARGDIRDAIEALKNTRQAIRTAIDTTTD
jgi:hypothetical protein